MRHSFFLKFAVILFTSQKLLLGWGDLGHKTVAYIAQANLSEKAKAMLSDILGSESLMVGAIFPDLVRSEEEFKKFSPFHFIEIPGQMTPEQVLAKDGKKLTAHHVVTNASKFIPRPKIRKAQKALMLRYLVHVVGDVHQPLHVGNGEDMGANACAVKWKDPETGLISENNLHTVWDERIFDYAKHDFAKQHVVAGGTKRYFDYLELGKMALEENELRFKNTAKKSALEWYAESKRLHSEVYPKVEGFEEPPYCKVKGRTYDKTKAPILDEVYARKALSIANKRIVEGGYQLAKLLNELAEEYKPQTKEELEAELKPMSREEIIDSVFQFLSEPVTQLGVPHEKKESESTHK